MRLTPIPRRSASKRRHPFRAVLLAPRPSGLPSADVLPCREPGDRRDVPVSQSSAREPGRPRFLSPASCPAVTAVRFSLRRRRPRKKGARRGDVSCGYAFFFEVSFSPVQACLGTLKGPVTQRVRGCLALRLFRRNSGPRCGRLVSSAIKPCLVWVRSPESKNIFCNELSTFRARIARWRSGV